MIQGDDILVTGDPATVMEAQELMDYLISASHRRAAATSAGK